MPPRGQCTLPEPAQRPKRNRQPPSVYCSGKGAFSISQEAVVDVDTDNTDEDDVPVSELLKRRNKQPAKPPARARTRVLSPVKVVAVPSRPLPDVAVVEEAVQPQPPAPGPFQPGPAVEGSFGPGVRHFAKWWRARTITDAVSVIMTFLMLAMIKHPVDYLLALSHTKRALVLTAYASLKSLLYTNVYFL